MLIRRSYHAHTTLIWQGLTDRERPTDDTMTVQSALDFEHAQKLYDGLTLDDDLWRLTETSQELPRLVVRLVSTLYTTDQDLQVIGARIVVVSGRKFCVTRALYFICVHISGEGIATILPCSVLMCPPPLGWGGHLDLLWFPSPKCESASSSVCPSVSVPDFIYIIFPTVFCQCLSNSQIWWPWIRPWTD